MSRLSVIIGINWACSGIYVVPYQQEFAVNQAEGALPYTIGAVFAFGGGAFAGRFAGKCRNRFECQPDDA